jgi:hypothetical protein
MRPSPKRAPEVPTDELARPPGGEAGAHVSLAPRAELAQHRRAPLPVGAAQRVRAEELLRRVWSHCRLRNRGTDSHVRMYAPARQQRPIGNQFQRQGGGTRTKHSAYASRATASCPSRSRSR